MKRLVILGTEVTLEPDDIDWFFGQTIDLDWKNNARLKQQCILTVW